MKRIFGGLIAALFLSSTTVMAADTIQTKGQVASVYTYSQDGCVVTQHFVSASRQSTETSDTLYTLSSVYNVCSGVQIRDAMGTKTLPPGELDFGRDYARLVATVEMFDTVTSAPLSLTYNLTWIGTGYGWVGNSNTRYIGPGYMIVVRSNGGSQDAQVQGAIDGQSVNWMGNLTDQRAGTVNVVRMK